MDGHPPQPRAGPAGPAGPAISRKDEQAAASFVALCTREPSPGQDALLRQVAASLSWAPVPELASRHRVAAYVQQATSRAGLAAPPEAAEALRETVLRDGLIAGVLQLTLRRVAAALRAAGTPVIVLKGPVLAPALYPAPRFRPFGDLDLTVSERDFPAAAATLVRDGFREEAYEAEEARAAHADHIHGAAAFHRKFVEPQHGSLVELHADPLQLGLEPRDEAGRWERGLPVPGLEGALMLCPEDQVVQLSVHAHKHGFERLIWLKDLDLLLRRHGAGMDWNRVRHSARAEGVTASVWYALQLTATLLATPISSEVDRTLRPSLPLRGLYRRTWPVDRVAGLEGFMRRRAVQFHAAESWRGMLPSLIYMGRRGDRARAIAQALRGA